MYMYVVMCLVTYMHCRWSCDYVVVSCDSQSSLEGVEETVSAITASVSQLFVITGHGLERCMQLTEGWGLPGLIRTLEVCESLYLSVYSQYTSVSLCIISVY